MLLISVLLAVEKFMTDLDVNRRVILIWIMGMWNGLNKAGS